MATKPKQAVLFAAKSSQDVRGSIPTQLADCRALAQQEGYEVSAEFSDEAASAYSGDRGPGLARAMAECERLAPCALVVQHSDRLARGDGRQAKHLVEYALWALKHDVKILSAQDSQTFGDLLYAVVTGQRNHEDSKRKGAAVAAGQRRRVERGKRLGGKIRDGYMLKLLEVDSRGNPVREVVLDPERAPIWRRIFDLIEQGHTPGEVREILNSQGVRMKSGKPWTTRAIRLGVRDDFYAGHARSRKYGKTIENDHEALIDPERWERIAAMIPSDGRAAPAQPTSRDWLLQGVATCGHCGESLYTRADRGTYACKAVRESRGTCEARPIPAEQAEQLVLDHLGDFVGGLEEWLAGRARETIHDREKFAKTLEDQRRELRNLDHRAQKAEEQYERLLDRGDAELADAALDQVRRLKLERDEFEKAIESGEAKLADWPTAPDVDAALDYYNELRDAIQGRLSGSQSVSELRAHLRATLEVAALDFDGADLFGTFLLRSGGGGCLVSGPCLEPVELEREVTDTTS